MQLLRPSLELIAIGQPKNVAGLPGSAAEPRSTVPCAWTLALPSAHSLTVGSVGYALTNSFWSRMRTFSLSTMEPSGLTFGGLPIGQIATASPPFAPCTGPNERPLMRGAFSCRCTSQSTARMGSVGIGSGCGRRTPG